MATIPPHMFPIQSQYGLAKVAPDLLEPDLAIQVGQRLRRRYSLSQDVQHRFISNDDIVEILDRDMIREVLRQKIALTKVVLDELVEIVCGARSTKRLIKILAILTLIDAVSYITKFVNANIYDDDLPLMEASTLCTRLDTSDSGKLDHFVDFQWHIDVPHFNLVPDEVKTRVFPSLKRLPFLHKELKSQGGQGKVWKVEIHPAHFHGDVMDTHFAIKQFAEADRHRWDDEIAALKRYSGSHSGHPHLIKLLAAYQHEGRGLFLVFPLAEGNLADFWKQKPSASRSFEDIRWLLEQCCEITSGLCKIHSHDSWGPTDKLGRHGDIKPENILWFKSSSVDRGRLVVADFTLTHFHDAPVDNTIPSQRGCTKTFRPPEVDFKTDTQKAQRCDVWSLGCVFLEFAAWYLLGYHAVREKTYMDQNGESQQGFNDARFEDDDCLWGPREDKYFNGPKAHSDQTTELKESVTKWIQLLHQSSQCSQAMHKFLDLITNSMLVVDPRNRCDMKTVLRELKDIFTNADDRNFTYVGYPRDTPGGDIGHPFFQRKTAAADNAYQTSLSEDSSGNSSTTIISLDTIALGTNRDYEEISKVLSDGICDSTQPYTTVPFIHVESYAGSRTQKTDFVLVNEDEINLMSPESLSPRQNTGDCGDKYNFSRGQEFESQAASSRCTSQASIHGQAAMNQSYMLSSQASDSGDDSGTPTTRLSTSCGVSRVSSSRDDAVDVAASFISKGQQYLAEISNTTRNNLSNTDGFEIKETQQISGCAPNADVPGMHTMESRPECMDPPAKLNPPKMKSVVKRRREKLELAWHKFWRTILGRKK